MFGKICAADLLCCELNVLEILETSLRRKKEYFGYSVNIVFVYCVRVQPPVTKPRRKKWMAKIEASNFLECVLLLYFQVFCQD